MTTMDEPPASTAGPLAGLIENFRHGVLDRPGWQVDRMLALTRP